MHLRTYGSSVDSSEKIFSYTRVDLIRIDCSSRRFLFELFDFFGFVDFMFCSFSLRSLIHSRLPRFSRLIFLRTWFSISDCIQHRNFQLHAVRLHILNSKKLNKLNEISCLFGAEDRKVSTELFLCCFLDDSLGQRSSRCCRLLKTTLRYLSNYLSASKRLGRRCHIEGDRERHRRMK